MPAIKLDFSKSSIVFISMLIISFFAFWPTYFSVFFDSHFYIHLHAFFAILWISLLIFQPYFIKARQVNVHRLIGKLSYFIAPLVVIIIFLLAHSRIENKQGAAFSIQSYILYLQISLSVLFSLIYLFAIIYRKSKSIHSRFMVATSFTLIDPILARILNIIDPNPTWNHQWLSFGLINLILITLSYIDRTNTTAKWVFPSLLILFLLIEIPIYFNLTGQNWWQEFAKWFASI